MVSISLLYATATIVSSPPSIPANAQPPESTCIPSCTIRGDPQAHVAGWGQRQIMTATVTAEEVIEIINTDVGTTRTVTQTNDLVSLPNTTNALGTVVRDVEYYMYGGTWTTQVAFPTALEIIPDHWVWNGVLSTLDAYGASACVTTEAATFSVNVTSLPRETVMPVDADQDPRGWNYQWEDVISDVSLGGADVADEPAFACVHEGKAGLPPDVLGRKMVAATSTAFEGGSG
ncbi:hypothetical protein Q7P37_005288 [Cladosporium fusiforme]